MVERKRYILHLKKAIERSPVTALFGPRESGKTTLARMAAGDHQSTFFDLESRQDQAKLQNPEMMLGSLSGLVIIDEIQIMPELFNVLKVLADRPANPAKFLIIGSASPSIIKSVSKTLAGRIEVVDMAGFDIEEVGETAQQALWVRGGFPKSFLAASEEESAAWREGFIRTFLERDIPQLGITIPAAVMRRFWTMLAHCHGQIWNSSELARSMGLSDKTVRSYLDILTQTHMVRQLLPWHENTSKRQVKTPKVYLRDTGLLHSLLSIDNYSSLYGHPRVGASWEGFALEQIVRFLRATQVYYWAAYSGAKLDLMFVAAGKRYGIEFKYRETPVLTRSIRTAIKDLSLEHLWVIYPGRDTYEADDKITVCALEDFI